MHGSIDTSSALASGVPLVIRQAAFIPQGRSERRVMTCLGRRRDGGQRDIELWEAPLSKRKSQSCCGRRPDHDGTLGFDKGAREPRIHTTRSAVNRPHTICQKIWHLIGAGPKHETRKERDIYTTRSRILSALIYRVSHIINRVRLYAFAFAISTEHAAQTRHR